MRQQVELVHRHAQLREYLPGLRIDAARFHAPLRAAEAIAQRTLLVRVAEFAQKLADGIGLLARRFHLPQRDRAGDPPRLRVFEHPALKRPALPRPVRINPTLAIRTQRRARLAKKRHRRPPARDRHRQAECFQFMRIVARAQLDVVEERAIAAKATGEAEFFS